MSQLFARKPIAELVPGDESSGLRRELGVSDLVLLSIGAVIGAGTTFVAGYLTSFIAPRGTAT